MVWMVLPPTTMTKLSGTRINASKDALRYTLFLVEKVSQTPNAKYERLLRALYQQWQPGIFQGTLPEAATMISSLDEAAWGQASIDKKNDIEALVRGGAALHQRYGSMGKSSFLQRAQIVVAPGLLDGLYQDIATMLSKATQEPLAESRALLEDCSARLRERISGLETTGFMDSCGYSEDGPCTHSLQQHL